MQSSRYSTPIADALLSIRDNMRYSFHALPVLNGHSIAGSPLAGLYTTLLGPAVLGSELTATGRIFDSFFFPKTAIRESEALAARLFGADGTLYVTTGTTTSNQIAATALYRRQGPVLIDKNCHQSIHFVLDTLGAPVHHIASDFHCEKSERGAWHIDALLAQVCDAERTGAPYELIVFTAQSYEGVVYDIPRILGALLDAGCSTRRFLVDEAWGCANYFNPRLKALTALNLDALIARYPDLEVVCTQSAHKSISCLRQASMIHFRGAPALRERLDIAKFRIHSTSPSYPVLISLDLAQAQMAVEGDVRVGRAVALADDFRRHLASSPEWSAYQVYDLPDMGTMNDYVRLDPCKISLDTTALNMSAGDMQTFLYERHGLYVNRLTQHSLLLNFHIGIDETASQAMLDGLAALQRACGEQAAHAVSRRFVIPYPPGVPLLVPGEPITDAIHEKIARIRRNGVALLEI